MPDDYSAAAHTRGKTVLKAPVPVNQTCVAPSINDDPPVWKASMIDLTKMQRMMNQAIKDCIEKGKRRKFGVFMKTLDPKQSRGTPLDNNDQCED